MNSSKHKEFIKVQGEIYDPFEEFTNQNSQLQITIHDPISNTESIGIYKSHLGAQRKDPEETYKIPK